MDNLLIPELNQRQTIEVLKVLSIEYSATKNQVMSATKTFYLNGQMTLGNNKYNHIEPDKNISRNLNPYSPEITSANIFGTIIGKNRQK